MIDPAHTLRALVEAVRADDGTALDALVHPVHGAWLWEAPGAEMIPSAHLKVGGGRPLARLGGLGANRQSGLSAKDYRANYLQRVAALGDWLARIDRDPADPDSPIYGTCDERRPPSAPLRSKLISKESFSQSYKTIATERGVHIAPALMGDMAVFSTPSAAVWLVRDRGRLWVAHVMIWDPCSA